MLLNFVKGDSVKKMLQLTDISDGQKWTESSDLPSAYDTKSSACYNKSLLFTIYEQTNTYKRSNFYITHYFQTIKLLMAPRCKKHFFHEK